MSPEATHTAFNWLTDADLHTMKENTLQQFYAMPMFQSDTWQENPEWVLMTKETI